MKKIISIILSIAIFSTVLVGCTSTTGTTTTTKTSFDKEVDFLVIGGGASGLSSALEAADNGVKDILVVEKLGTIGGTTFISQGMIAGYDTKVQAAEGSVPTNYDEMYNNLMKNATYRLDPDLTKITVSKSGETIDWLIDRVNVTFDPDVLVGYGPLEMMHVVEGGGQGMLEPFQTALDAAGVEVMTNTTATSLIQDANGTVIGAKCNTKDGEITIGAKAVMIATGGYANNPELTTLLDPEFKGTMGIGFASCTGDGLIMASNAGAAITHTSDLMAVLKDYEIMKYHNGTSASASVAGMPTRPANAIFVGSEGKRFVNEKAAGYMSQALNRPIFDQMHKDNLGYVWAISDVNAITELNIKRSSEMEYITADTIEELAELMDVDAAGLKATIEKFNADAANGFDTEFKRTKAEGLAPLTAPYVALAMMPCEIITYGGVARNEWSEVIRADGTTIDGLYVAGEAAANSAYMGFTISNAFTWGRIAGENAANYILGNERKASIVEKDETVEETKVRFDMATPLNDGEYTATVKGQEGDLEVKTVVANGKISSVEVVSHNETDAIAQPALESIPSLIASENSVDVDVVSGATLTSNRIMDAVAQCLQQAAA